MGELLLADADFFLRAGDFLPGLVAQAGKFLDARAIGGGPLLGPLEGVADGDCSSRRRRVRTRLRPGRRAPRRLSPPARPHRRQAAPASARAPSTSICNAAMVGGKHVELMPPEAALELGQFVEAGLVTARLAGLPLERADLPLHFADDVGEADRLASVCSSLRSASFFWLLYLVMPAASSKIARRSSGRDERIWSILPCSMIE